MRCTEFNKTIWNKTTKKARKVKVLVIFFTLFIATVFFGIRDCWFTAQAVCCWEDYVLYLILAVGSNIASYIKNLILSKSYCFVSTDRGPIGIQDFLETQNATIEGIVYMIKERD